jgi:hypothetical protein
MQIFFMNYLNFFLLFQLNFFASLYRKLNAFKLQIYTLSYSFIRMQFGMKFNFEAKLKIALATLSCRKLRYKIYTNYDKLLAAKKKSFLYNKVFFLCFKKHT